MLRCESGTVRLLDLHRQGARPHVALPPQRFRYNQSLPNGRGRAGFTAPQHLRAERLKCPVIQARDLLWRKPTGAKLLQVVYAEGIGRGCQDAPGGQDR